jgi:hypothetical protein
VPDPDPDLAIVARVIFAAEPEGDKAGAKAALGRLALKLFVLEQVGALSHKEEAGAGPAAELPSDR